MWYAVQTETGREPIAKKMIEDSFSADSFPTKIDAECRLIMAEGKRRYQGKWNKVSKPMFSGYLFIITDQIDLVYERLKRVQLLTKILGTGKEIVPLSDKEERFLNSISDINGHISMSYGVQEGDKIIITEGSLKGMEYMIKKIDRHKRKGYIEIDFLGENRLVEVGLEIVRKN